MSRRGLVLLVLIATAGCGAPDAADRCGDNCSRTEVSANVRLNACPHVTELVIVPSLLRIGGTAQIAALAEDPEDDPMFFFWNASSGQVSAPEAAESAYTCEDPGQQTLTLWLFDGSGCTSRTHAAIDCVQ